LYATADEEKFGVELNSAPWVHPRTPDFTLIGQGMGRSTTKTKFW